MHSLFYLLFLSTLTSIFYRHAIEHSMNIVLPPTSGLHIPSFLSQTYEKETPWHKAFVEEKLYDFSGWHVGWDKEQFRYELSPL